jgi:clan AA aspartic protease
MTGVVHQGVVAQVRVRLIGPDTSVVVTAIIDTGYNGALSIPQSLADQLRLPRGFLVQMTTADGHAAPAFTAKLGVEWDGVVFQTNASCFGNDVILGMTALAGHRLTMDVLPGGVVEITKLV